MLEVHYSDILFSFIMLDLGERQLYKNRLQEYTQRLGLPFPVYQTTNEGFQHAPRFRSTVLVDGSSYTSTDTFLQRKAAEQDASRVALDELTPKMKDEGRRLICKVCGAHYSSFLAFNCLFSLLFSLRNQECHVALD